MAAEWRRKREQVRARVETEVLLQCKLLWFERVTVTEKTRRGLSETCVALALMDGMGREKGKQSLSPKSFDSGSWWSVVPRRGVVVQGVGEPSAGCGVRA